MCVSTAKHDGSDYPSKDVRRVTYTNSYLAQSFTNRFAHISTKNMICLFSRRLSARDKKKNVSCPPESRDVGEIDSYFQRIQNIQHKGAETSVQSAQRLGYIHLKQRIFF